MRFTRYKICKIEVNSNELRTLEKLNEETTFKNLKNSKKMSDFIGEFAISQCIHEENIIVGNLSQTYGIDLIKFSDNSKKEIPINENKANDNRTYFFINCKEASIYIQNRRYTQRELNPNLVVKRIEKLLNNNLSDNALETIILQKENINYKIEELQEYFRQSFVKSVEFNNISNMKLEIGTKLHNPRIDLDDAAVESWNAYSSESVESVKIKAKKDKSIAKNPIANIGFKLAEQNKTEYDRIIKNIEIEKDGQKEQIKPKGNEYLIVNVSDKDKNVDEALNKIIIFLKKRKI